MRIGGRSARARARARRRPRGRRGRPGRVVHRDRRHDGRQRVVPERRHGAAVRAGCDRLHVPARQDLSDELRRRRLHRDRRLVDGRVPPAVQDRHRRARGHDGDARPRAGRRRLVQPPGESSRSAATTRPRGSRAAPRPTYSGPDSGSASVTGTCRDNAGNVSATASFGLRYDTTAPTVTAKLSRAPDSNGWYSHPVTVSFVGTDGGSGVSSCTAPVSYSGPDSAKATISGGCVDAAGNRASASVSLAVRLDGTQARGRRRLGRLAQRDAELARAGGHGRVDHAHSRPGKAACSGPVSRPRIELPRHAAQAGRHLPVPARGDGRRGEHERRVGRGARADALPARRRARGSRPATCSPGRPSRDRRTTTSRSTAARARC